MDVFRLGQIGFQLFAQIFDVYHDRIVGRGQKALFPDCLVNFPRREYIAAMLCQQPQKLGFGFGQCQRVARQRAAPVVRSMDNSPLCTVRGGAAAVCGWYTILRRSSALTRDVSSSAENGFIK